MLREYENAPTPTRVRSRVNPTSTRSDNTDIRMTEVCVCVCVCVCVGRPRRNVTTSRPFMMWRLVLGVVTRASRVWVLRVLDCLSMPSKRRYGNVVSSLSDPRHYPGQTLLLALFCLSPFQVL